MPKAKSAVKPKKVAKKARKAKSGARGVEPILEGPYANAGPEYEKRIKAGL
jgi:hypothetical protein